MKARGFIINSISVVLPAFNEAARIENTVSVTADTLSKITDRFEIIIAEDGSTDGTDRIAAELANKYDYVIHLHSDERQGRGRALNRAFKAASGDVLCYIDVDLATDMKHLEQLCRAVSTGGYDFATGSRMMPKSDSKRPFKREFASRGYNFLVRLFLRSKLYDHQCGFKAFRRDALFELLDEIENQHWFWDTELLVRAQYKGYKILEFPVHWRHGGTSKVNIVKDVYGMGSEIFRLWWELFVAKFFLGKKKVLIAALLAVLILALIATLLGTSEIIETAKQASPGTLALAFFIYCLSWPLRGVRFQQILKRLGSNYELGFLTGSIFISQSANVVLPARIGDLSRLYILNKNKNLSLTTGLSSLTVERVFDVVAITLISILAFFEAASRLEPAPWISSLIGLAGLAVVFFFAVLLLLSFRDKHLKIKPEARPEIKSEMNSKIDSEMDSEIKLKPEINSEIKAQEISSSRLADKIKDFAGSFIHQISIVAVRPGAFVKVLASSVLIWSIDIFTCFFVLRAFSGAGIALPFTFLMPLVFLAVAIGNIAKIFPITPGAIGTYEMALTAVFGLGGIKPELGFTVAVLDHIIKNSITLIGGGFAISELGLKWKEVLSTDSQLLKGV